MTLTTATHQPLRRLGVDALSAIAEGIASADPAALLPDGTTRRWALAVRTEIYEAWVIAWPAGAGDARHDGSRISRSAWWTAGSEPSSTAGSVVRWLRPGAATVLAHDHVHEVVNVGTEEVVSVHVYSPPLADMSFRHDPDLDL